MLGLKIIIAVHCIFYLHNKGICDGLTTTLEPTTVGETTLEPTTVGETTLEPTTVGETTLEPTTVGETTLEPTTGGETTLEPGTGGETTLEPGTGGETTLEPGTGGETTLESGTGGETTLEPGTGGETTLESGTGGETTLEPGTGGETTLEPGTGGETTEKEMTTMAPNLDREFCYDCGTIYPSFGHYPAFANIRVVGGQEASKGMFPAIVAVIKVLPNKEFNRCGGTLIKPGWVLTSASCVINSKIKRIYVSVNDHDLGTTGEMKSKTYSVYKSIIHPRFQSHNPSREHDIALIRLVHPVDLSTTSVRPICLGITDDETSGTNTTTMVGWGQKIGGDDTSYSSVLSAVNVAIHSSTECQQMYDDLPYSHYHYKITENMICTFTQGKDSCHGDGGGPVLKQLKDGRYVQIGVIGFGYGCGKFNVPGVHLRLSQYRHWINYVTYNEHC